MKFTAALISALLVAGFSSGAGAGPIADAAGRAEALQAEGKTVEALDALNEAVDSVWTQAPLAFRKVVLVESSEGFGEYVERSDRVFRPDEQMNIYVEPVGFGYGASGAAAAINFDVDVSIENLTGQVLGEAKDVFQFSADTYPNRREFAMTLGFGAPYYRPGDYKVIFTVRDRNSAKSGNFEIPFTLTTPGAAGAEADSAAPPADEAAGGNAASDAPPQEESAATIPDAAQESGSEASENGAANMQGSGGAADQSSDQSGAAAAPLQEPTPEAEPQPGAAPEDGSEASTLPAPMDGQSESGQVETGSGDHKGAGAGESGSGETKAQ